MIDMASTVEAPQQYKQPSRKGKKAWRKYVDVSEIQEGLEKVKEEIIAGGIVAEKPSNALFTVDTKGSETIQRSYNRLHKPLKADQILAFRSAVPAIDSHKRSRVTDGVIEPSTKKQKQGWIGHKEYERLKKIAYNGATFPRDVIETNEAPDHDPWDSQMGEIMQDFKFSYLEKSKPIRAPSTLREAPISLIAGRDSVPAVVKPKPGTSYNPAFQDWDQLLVEEGEKEVEAEKKRLLDAQLEKENLDRITKARDEIENIQTEDESAWEGFDSEYEQAEWLSKRRPERKTPAERNKVKRRKIAERQAKLDNQTKERARQAQQIEAIARKIYIEAKAIAPTNLEVAPTPLEEIDDRILRRRKLGNYSVPEPPLELVLPEELQDSLRLLKPEGNLLKDRFRSILIRGKVETRRPIQQPKKAKRTFTEKWTYKDFQLPT